MRNILHGNVFHSARLKLTAFYFVILVVFTLVLTFGVRALTTRELHDSDKAQRGTVNQLFNQPQYGDGLASPFGTRYFANQQANQAGLTRQHLNRDYVLMDVVLLAAGGAASWWFAGKTLRPIEEAHERQKRFTSDASHELRTPLAAIKLENEVFLRSSGATLKDAKALITSNLEEVNRLEKLAQSLLALNHYEHETLPHEPVAVAELVGEALGRVSAKVQFTQMITPAAIDINRDSVVELLAIVLDNAAKYGGGMPVDITGELVHDTYELRVHDHGPGIAEQDLPYVFDRMFRGDKARSNKTPGYGIGLSLAKQIAAANEATIAASNAPDGGAVFTVTFA